MNLITLAMCAAHGPIVGVRRRWPTVAHAVTIDHALKGWPKARTVEAACGRRVALLWPVIWWAPRIRGTKITRCPGCVELHGAKTRQPPRWARP